MCTMLTHAKNRTFWKWQAFQASFRSFYAESPTCAETSAEFWIPDLQTGQRSQSSSQNIIPLSNDLLFVDKTVQHTYALTVELFH